MEARISEPRSQQAIDCQLQAIVDDGSFDLLIELFRRSSVQCYIDMEGGKGSELEQLVMHMRSSTRLELLVTVGNIGNLQSKVSTWLTSKLGGLRDAERETFMNTLDNNDDLYEFCTSVIRDTISKQIEPVEE